MNGGKQSLDMPTLAHSIPSTRHRKATMTKPAPTPTTAIAVQEPSLDFVQHAVQTFEGIDRLATLMSKMGTLPDHLKGKPADCFRIVVQAAKWRLDPFMVAECTSLVHGRFCLEGKLVAAVLASRGIRLTHQIEGRGQDARITLTGRLPGEDQDRTIHGSVREWRTTANGSPWDKQPETQLVYRGTRQWARIHAPDAMLGVRTPDEMEDVREVQATVIATAEPARVAQPVASGPSAQVVTTTDERAPSGATAPADEPARMTPSDAEQRQELNAQQPRAKTADMDHVKAGRALFAAWCTEDAAAATALIKRLGILHGAAVAKNIPEANRGKYLQDCANLQGRSLADAADLITTWENQAAKV